MARAWYWSSRWLPNGWIDAFRQLLLFAGAYYAYRIVRGMVDGEAGVAFENARDIISAERSMNLFFEQDFQEWALSDARWIVDGANWMYVNSHFVLTVGFLIWLYLARNEAYYFVRNMFMVAMGIALVGYVRVPDGAAAVHAGVGLPGHGHRVGRAPGGHITPTRSTTRSPRCRACTWPSR